MKLTKKGLHRDRGLHLVFEENNIEPSFVGGDNISLYLSGEDGKGNTYFYTLELTFNDIATILDSLEVKDKESGEINKSLEEALSTKSKTLFRLLMLSSNLLEDSK